jgi:DNA-binding transcriptional regulator YdaS (Cro superfamily)
MAENRPHAVAHLRPDDNPKLAPIRTIKRLQTRATENVAHLIIPMLPGDQKLALFLADDEKKLEHIVKTTATPAQRIKATEQALEVAQAQLRELLIYQVGWEPLADHFNDLLAQVHNPDIAPVIQDFEADTVEYALIQAAIHIQWPEQAASLQPSAESAKDKGITLETQDIIRRAVAEVEQTSTPEHHTLDTVAELGAIATEATQLAETISSLRELGQTRAATEAEVAISGLQNIATHSNATAWEIGLHAIRNDHISQGQLAGMLGVSQSTVSRRYREATKEPK